MGENGRGDARAARQLGSELLGSAVVYARRRMSIHQSLKRTLAYLFDVVLLFVVLAPAALLVERWLDIKVLTPFQVWIATVLSFSIPTWCYFLLSDRSRSGATIGKRLLRLRVLGVGGERVSFGRAFARTAVKLLPWEVAHLFGFALAGRVGSNVQVTGLISANALAIAYLVAMVATAGRSSIHDLLVSTEVVPVSRSSAVVLRTTDRAA